MQPTTGVVRAIQSEHKARIDRNANHRNPAAACGECADTGIITGTARVCRCAAGREVVIQQKLEHAWRDLIPHRYGQYTLAQHPDNRARAVAGQWISGAEWNAQVGRNLVIVGPVGTGKTGLAIGILRNLHFLGVDVQYTNVADILATMTGTSWAEKGQQMAEYHDVPVLLLDDLGAEAVKDWSASVLYEVVEGRYRNGAPTIVTSNLTQTEMRASVGDRIVSRIFENAVRIDLGGGDRRKTSNRMVS